MKAKEHSDEIIMLGEQEFYRKCEFTCPRCKAVIRPSGVVDAYSEILRKGGEEKADEIIAETIEDMQKQHFKLHTIEDMLKREGIDGDEVEKLKKLEKDIITAISITRLEDRFGKAKIEFC